MISKTKNFKSGLVWGVLLGSLLLAANAFATTVVKMDLAQLVQQSDSIVQGIVDHTEVKWENNLAYTYAYVNIEDPMKGDRRSVAIIRQIGGKIGALNVDVAGMPKFTKGEEVILFLKGGSDGTFQVLGLNQGKYAVNENFAVSNVSGIDLYNPKTNRFDTPALIDKTPVEAFKAKIRGLMK